MYRRRSSSMMIPQHTISYRGHGEGEGVYAGEGIFAGGDHMYPHLLAGAKVMTAEQFLARKKPERYKKMTAKQWEDYLEAHAPLDKRTRNVNYKPKPVRVGPKRVSPYIQFLQKVSTKGLDKIARHNAYVDWLAEHGAGGGYDEYY